MRLTLVSTHPRLGDKDHNLDVMLRHIEAAKGDIVVFPEMATTGYVVRDRVHRLAEPLEGRTAQRVVDAAAEHGKWVLYGYPRQDDRRPGIVYNSATLAAPDGSLQGYDKRQLATFGPFEDGLFFTPGRRTGLFQTPWGRIGMSICYDLFFPELMKAQALAGAELLVNISASPNTSRRFFEMLLPARAVENALPVAYTNFAGTQDHLMFWGGAQLWGPRGTQKAVAPYFETGVTEVEVDRDEARNARPLRPTMRDTTAAALDDLRAAFDVE